MIRKKYFFPKIGKKIHFFNFSGTGAIYLSITKNHAYQGKNHTIFSPKCWQYIYFTIYKSRNYENRRKYIDES